MLPNVMKLQAWLGLRSVRRCAEIHVRRQARVHSAKAFMAQRVVAAKPVSHLAAGNQPPVPSSEVAAQRVPRL